MTTKIPWADETWNPISGCTKISAGCAKCYAERMSKRLAGRFGYPAAPHNFDVTLHPDKLDQPLHWKKPRRIFVASMGDLFHEDLAVGHIEPIFQVMQDTPRHTYLLLTKRPKRMDAAWRSMCQTFHGGYPTIPLPNVWLGTTVENADQLWRIPVLLETPAAVRFVSAEPMLGPVDLFPRFSVPEGPPRCVQCGRELRRYYPPNGGMAVQHPCPSCGEIAHHYDSALSWVICGAESGPGARPMELDWARDLRNQCTSAGVPFFFKRVSDGNRELDGRLWEQWPEVRQ